MATRQAVFHRRRIRMMQYFRYSLSAVSADYARCATGFACTLGPLWLVRPAAAIAWVLGGAAALFFVYFARTIVRNFTCVALDEIGIRTKGAFDSSIPWDNLCLLRLNYYTTRDDRSGGWMQLELRGGRQTIGVDSHIEGFVYIAKAAVRVALRRGLPIDPKTLTNLRALGIAADAGHEAVR